MMLPLDSRLREGTRLRALRPFPLSAASSRWLRALTLALSALVVAGCGGNKSQPATADPAEPSATPVCQSDPSSGSGRVQTLRYDEAGHLLDMYLPESPEIKAPIVLLVHGAASDASPKDFEGYKAWGARLSRAGYLAVVPNYDAEVGGSTNGVDQLLTALDCARSRAGDVNADGAHVVTMGFSAGGSDWLGLSFDSRAQPISGVIGYYALIEPTAAVPGAASLSASLLQDNKPTFLAYAKQDTAPGILESLETFRQNSTGSGSDTEIAVHQSAGHAFDAFERDGRTRAIERQTLRFLSDVTS